MISPGETVRNDFRTDVDPTLFIDNWGTDVVNSFPDKVTKPIDTIVALAQLMTSIQTGEQVDGASLDTTALDGFAFFDGSDGESDHFFNISSWANILGGSYPGTRVSAELTTGQVNLEASTYTTTPSAYSTYDTAWSTLRGDVIKSRASERFELDQRRLSRALLILEGLTVDNLPTARPFTWQDTPSNQTAYDNAIQRLSRVKQPIYLGAAPLNGVGVEPKRKIHIPFLDGI